MTIYEDNQASICIANDSQCTKKTKHIDIKYHFIREQVLNGNIILKYCKSSNMIADILTKPLTHEKFINGRNLLGVCEH